MYSILFGCLQKDTPFYFFFPQRQNALANESYAPLNFYRLVYTVSTLTRSILLDFLSHRGFVRCEIHRFLCGS